MTCPCPTLIRFLRIAVLVAGALVAAEARSIVVVYEYYNATHDHYFRTANQAEALDLDAHPERGWERTGHDFVAHDRSEVGAIVEFGAVCRFFAPAYTSHFYTANAAECNMVRVRWPDVWIFEEIAFAAVLPESGHCPDTWRVLGNAPVPVYRVYNNTTSGNHRYVTDPALYLEMQQRGWLPEGVALCAYGLTVPQMQSLGKVLALLGNWRFFDAPMVFSGIGQYSSSPEPIFSTGAVFAPPGETMYFVTRYVPSEDRFRTNEVRSCGVFIFAGLCSTKSFEFAFDGDIDHVSGSLRIVTNGLFGTTDDVNRFKGVRQ